MNKYDCISIIAIILGLAWGYWSWHVDYQAYLDEYQECLEDMADSTLPEKAKKRICDAQAYGDL